MPIYSGECSEELAPHVCTPCPQNSERELGRVRSAGFVFSDYYPTLIAAPLTLSVWLTGIQTGKIIVVPETAGSYDPGEPKELKGYGDKPVSYGPRTFTLTFLDPNLVDNYAHYNGLGNQTELVPFFRTSTQLRFFDKAAAITASDPVADDHESEVVWNVKATVVSSNIPSYHAAATLLNTIFKCSYLNSIDVTPPPSQYDTTADFTADPIVTNSVTGVTAQIPAASSVIKVKYNEIIPQLQLPVRMDLFSGSTALLAFTAPGDYVGQTIVYIDSAGVSHNVVFAAGDVQLT